MSDKDRKTLQGTTSTGLGNTMPAGANFSRAGSNTPSAAKTVKKDRNESLPGPPADEGPRIDITVDIKQVKIHDDVLQGTEAMTVIKEEKQSIAVPFKSPISYTYSSLSEDFIFKYAILQDDELIGVLYLEIPYRYKFSKKFKIDDWFVVKPYEKATVGNERHIMARVVLKYKANCKYNQDMAKNLEGVEVQMNGSPKKEFNGQLKDVNKTIQEHEKEGFHHLEEVEKRIRARRARGALRSGQSTEMQRKGTQGDKENIRTGENSQGNSATVLKYTLTRNKHLDLGTKNSRSPSVKTRHFNPSDGLIPDDLFRGAGKGGVTKGSASVEQDKLVGKMAKDLGMLREEITSLRAKIKALEEGQMTVDNLKLTKQLDGEREEFNRERASVLKKFAEKSEKLDLERARLMEDIKKREAEIQRMKAETEDEKQKLQVAKLEIDEARAANERTSKELDDMELILRNKTKDLEKQIIEFAREKEELKEYAGELDSMKEKLMKERDNIVQEKAKLAVEIENAKNESKLIQDEKADWEKKKERDGRDLAKKNQELETREERLGRDARDLESKKEELQISKNGVENDKKEVAKMKEELEEHNIALWTDRNKLNQEVREFLEDKKVMESDMKWQRTELEEAAKGLQKEKDELDQERREMNEYQESLEQLKLELEARERKLMHDQEDFYKMKKSYLDKILEGGNYEQMTPEMRKMAEDMGINVEEMIEEGKKLHERRSQLEKLKLDNDQHLAKIKELNKRNTSNSQSRRASFTKIPSGLESPNSMAGAHARKAAVKDYITGLYEMASTKQLMKEFDEKKQEVVKAREELDFSKKIIEKLRTDNKAVKRELDIATKIMEEMRAGNSNIDLNKLLGRSQKEASMQTDGAIVDGGIVTVMNQEYNEMQERIRDLEHKLRRKDLTDKVQTRAAASEEGDLDDPAAIKEIDRELQELLDEIRKQQQEAMGGGEDTYLVDRVKRVQYLFYNFIHNIIKYLLRMGKMRQQDREFLEVLVRGLKGTGGRPAANGGLAMDGELASKLRDAYDTIAKLERRNGNLIEVLQSLKSTYEFFEVTNDMDALYGNPSVLRL